MLYYQITAKMLITLKKLHKLFSNLLMWEKKFMEVQVGIVVVKQRNHILAPYMTVLL